MPTDATVVTLVLGLEQVTGKVWFDDLKLAVAKPPVVRVANRFQVHPTLVTASRDCAES